MRRLGFVALAAALSGCAGVGPGEDRPFVITSGSQVGDLYWNGELTDSRSNRWNVWILPGIAPSVQFGGEAWGDAWRFARRLGEGDYWAERGDDVCDGLEFAGQDTVQDFWLSGTREDFSEASEAIAANLRETPFGWIPRVLGNAAWGYVIKPLARLGGMPLGVAGGLSYAVAAPTLQVAARPVGGLGYGVAAGTAAPLGRIAFHHPAFLLALFNREPAPRHDGSFGLEIISGPDAFDGAWDAPEGEGLAPLLAEPAAGAPPTEAPGEPGFELELATYLRATRRSLLVARGPGRGLSESWSTEQALSALGQVPLLDELRGLEDLTSPELVWVAWGRISALDPSGALLDREAFLAEVGAICGRHAR
ncbi:MAG: hypothetical protein KDD82_00045 [Planctomycetes bacterium]|nr:hypothetical protein [Planctomycetota bacterium]